MAAVVIDMDGFAARLVDKVMRIAAKRYAEALVDGDRILDEVDGDYIEPFRMHLPAALARRHMHLEPCKGGYVVRVTGAAS